MIVAILSLVIFISVTLNIILVKAAYLASDKIDEYESWILNYQEEVKETYLMLKMVDEKEIFERDDEVGFVFSNILSIVNDLKEKTYVETSEETKKVSQPKESQTKAKNPPSNRRLKI